MDIAKILNEVSVRNTKNNVINSVTHRNSPQLKAAPVKSAPKPQQPQQQQNRPATANRSQTTNRPQNANRPQTANRSQVHHHHKQNVQKTINNIMNRQVMQVPVDIPVTLMAKPVMNTPAANINRFLTEIYNITNNNRSFTANEFSSLLSKLNFNPNEFLSLTELLTKHNYQSKSYLLINVLPYVLYELKFHGPYTTVFLLLFSGTRVYDSINWTTPAQNELNTLLNNQNKLDELAKDLKNNLKLLLEKLQLSYQSVSNPPIVYVNGFNVSLLDQNIGKVADSLIKFF